MDPGKGQMHQDSKGQGDQQLPGHQPQRRRQGRAVAGGAARPVLELAGIKGIRTKSFGTNNKINTVKATIEGLKQLRSAEQVAQMRGKTVEEILG